MSATMEELPAQMSLSALEKRCMDELAKYRRKEPSNEQYCLEMFHRAIVKQDEQAWGLLIHDFGGIVLGWLRRHAKRDSALQYDSETNYVAKTFTRFWQATRRNEGLEFRSLSAAFAYLHACLNGAILDTLRAHNRPNLISLPEPGCSEEPATEDLDNNEEVWKVLISIIPSKREQRLAHLLFYCGLKAREVVHYCSDEFSDVQEVYRLRRNIIERLERNIDLIRWRLGQGE